MKNLFLLLFLGVSSISIAQDTLIAKLLSDFNNRPAGISNDMALQLMTDSNAVELIVINSEYQVDKYFPWPGTYIYNNETLQEASYNDGWKMGAIISQSKINKPFSNYLRFLFVVVFFLIFLSAQIEGMVRYQTVKQDRIYDSSVNEFIKLSEKKFRFNTNKFLFLVCESSFWISVLGCFGFSLIMLQNNGTLFVSLFVFCLFSAFLIFGGGLMNAWWYKKALEKLAPKIWGPFPPSDVD